jgi:hypothetical protein
MLGFIRESRILHIKSDFVWYVITTTWKKKLLGSYCITDRHIHTDEVLVPRFQFQFGVLQCLGVSLDPYWSIQLIQDAEVFKVEFSSWYRWDRGQVHNNAHCSSHVSLNIRVAKVWFGLVLWPLCLNWNMNLQNWFSRFKNRLEPLKFVMMNSCRK